MNNHFAFHYGYSKVFARGFVSVTAEHVAGFHNKHSRYNIQG